MASLIDAVKRELKTHFRARDLEKRQSLVERWKAEGTYPYVGHPQSPSDVVERDVFDICAITISEDLPSFERGEPDSRGLTLRLLRESITSSPSNLQRVLREVLKLTPERQAELAALLDQTSLDAIIRASKMITERLAFIGGLEQILFDPEYVKKLKERQQLQRILVQELWVFGEQYALGHDDQTLRKLLESHIEKVFARKELIPEVKDINGNPSRRPDLMLWRQYPQRKDGEFEHLVVELKRPSLVLGEAELSQIRRYAHSVSADARFDKGKTRWKFLLVGDTLDAFAQSEAAQNGREPGLITQLDHVEVWVKPWASIIADCKWRYQFYRTALEYDATHDDSAKLLNAKHKALLPPLAPKGGIVAEGKTAKIAKSSRKT